MLSAVRDISSETRPDDPGTYRSREDQVYRGVDESHDGVWQSSQGNANEPQGICPIVNFPCPIFSFF